MAAGGGSSSFGVRLWIQGGKQFSKDVHDARNEVKGLGDDGRSLGASLLKPAAALSALSYAAQAASAGGAGLVALASGLAPLAGVAASGAAGLLAVKSSAGLVKLAMTGMDESMKGVFDEFSRSTPATNALADQVRGLTPQLLHLRNMAQTRILGGVQDGLKAATPLLKTFQPAVGQTADVLGGLARRAGQVAVGLGPEMARVLKTNANLIQNVGRAGIALAPALVHILDAARPLTAWLGRMTLKFAQSINAMTASGKASGALGAFFGETQKVLRRVGSIGGSLATIFGAVGRAAYPLGKDILVSIDRGLGKIAAWATSIQGGVALRAWFDRARAPLHQTALLVRDIGKAFGTLAGGSDTLSPFISAVRTQLLPVLVKISQTASGDFGPKLVGLLTDLANAFLPLLAQGGAIGLYIAVLSNLARSFSWIMTNVPGAARALSYFGLALAAIRVVSVIAGLVSLTAAFVTNTAAMVSARFAQASFAATFLVVRAGMIAGTAATWLATAATTAFGIAMAVVTSPIFIVVAAVAAVAAGLYLLYTRSETFRGAVQAVWSFITNNWKTIGTVLAGPLAPIILLITHFRQFRSAAGSALSWVVQKGRDMYNWFQGLPGRMSGIFSGMWDGMKRAFRSVVNWIIGAWNGLDFKLPSVNTHIPGVGKVGGFTIGTPDIPLLAGGGRVMGTGSRWISGEAGPELGQVVPGGVRVTPLGTMPGPTPMSMPAARRRGGDDVPAFSLHVNVGDFTVRIGNDQVAKGTASSVTSTLARQR